ncbi:MAG: hypothetical protein BM564_05905 [Bacteroidetes bacterium MedPE-SWsnd-G2]|nr:MAG: hypothetical protein BM564_05905 [Bacteroidetes bacterium MedPE-SWsnd-G2]
MTIIWQISNVHFKGKSLITGTLLRDSPYMHLKAINSFKNVFKLLQTYFISPYALKDIRLKIDNEYFSTSTNKKGSFSIVVNKANVTDIKLFSKSSEIELPSIQTYPRTFPMTSSKYDVISDIDDTIMVSYTADFFKRISTLAFVSPLNRKVIGFTQALLKHFESQNARVFYVSKSERNLFNHISVFISTYNLPKGVLNLTPYLKLHQLLDPKKGKDYKTNHIRFIIENSPDKKFVLIGDDSQRDMDVYTSIAKQFKPYIVKIYIRQTKRKSFFKNEDKWNKLLATGVPSLYFNEEDDLTEEIKSFSNLISNLI